MLFLNKQPCFRAAPFLSIAIRRRALPWHRALFGVFLDHPVRKLFHPLGRFLIENTTNAHANAIGARSKLALCY